MKTKLILFLSSMLVGGVAVGFAVEGTNSSVRFHEPEKFTDFKLTSFGGTKEISYLEGEFRKEIERLAAAHLPPGFKLNVVFSDIAMAGDFEPQLGPDFDHVRIVKDIYPPRLQFYYEIIDENGNVIQRGEQRLTDLAYLQKVRSPVYEPLEHEFDLLNNFVRKLGNTIAS